MSSPDTKTQLRTAALARRKALRAEIAKIAAHDAQQHFFLNVPLTADTVIAVYWPIRDEMDTRGLLGQLIDQGIVTCLPVVVADDQPLTFRQWDGLSPLDVAGFGTMAPGPDAPEVRPDIILMPLAGFDMTGNRLGYGKGYYDRTIAALNPKPKLIGYGFSTQQVDPIPAEPHDVKMDMMISELGMMLFGGQGNKT